MDNKTTIQELKDLLNDFKNERDWGQFHDPKNLAEALSVEAGELLELFLWMSLDDVKNKIDNDENFREEVSRELADVINYCLAFANSTNIDISTSVKDKLKLNDIKYPVEKFKGIATKYNKL